MGKDQFVVFVRDARNGAPRDADGLPFRPVDGVEAAECAALCADRREANEFASDVVKRHPELCCAVYDFEGKANPPLEEIYDPSVRDKFVGIAHARRQALGGAAIFSLGITLVLIDGSRNLEWMWGYILGLKSLVMGGIFMSRGFLEWREFRNKELAAASELIPR